MVLIDTLQIKISKVFYLDIYHYIKVQNYRNENYIYRP